MLPVITAAFESRQEEQKYFLYLNIIGKVVNKA